MPASGCCESHCCGRGRGRTDACGSPASTSPGCVPRSGIAESCGNPVLGFWSSPGSYLQQKLLASALSSAGLPVGCMTATPKKSTAPCFWRRTVDRVGGGPASGEDRRDCEWEWLLLLLSSNHPGFCPRDPGEGLLIRAWENQLCLLCEVRRRPLGLLPSRPRRGKRQASGRCRPGAAALRRLVVCISSSSSFHFLPAFRSFSLSTASLTSEIIQCALCKNKALNKKSQVFLNLFLSIPLNPIQLHFLTSPLTIGWGSCGSSPPWFEGLLCALLRVRHCGPPPDAH